MVRCGLSVPGRFNPITSRSGPAEAAHPRPRAQSPPCRFPLADNRHKRQPEQRQLADFLRVSPVLPIKTMGGRRRALLAQADRTEVRMTADAFKELRSWATVRQLEYLEALERHGSERAAAKALNCAASSLRDSM